MDYHYFPASHWSRIISLVLAEKSLEPTRHLVDIRVNASFAPDYIRLNPRGVVPTIVDDGNAICNGPRIAEYLDSKAGPPLSAQGKEWSEALEDFPVMHLSYAKWVKALEGERSAQILDDKVDRAAQYAEKYPDLAGEYLRKQRYFEQFRAEVYDAEHRARMVGESSALLDRMTHAVRESGFIVGGEYSFADAIATSILYRLVDLGTLAEWHTDDEHPLSRYFTRMKERPSFKAVWEDDPLISQL